MNCKDIKGIFIHCLVPSSDFQSIHCGGVQKKNDKNCYFPKPYGP